jgi:hypothetical protein
MPSARTANTRSAHSPAAIAGRSRCAKGGGRDPCTHRRAVHPPAQLRGRARRALPLNQLPQINRPHTAYTVVGSGKTGMDAILWLLENGVPPSSIRWVMPRDAWLLNRANIQPGIEISSAALAALWRSSTRSWRPSPSPTCSRGWKRASCCCVSTRTCCPRPTAAPWCRKTS